MGVVYSAHDPDLDRKVALKLLLSQQRVGSEGSARLLREAQALAKLSHPNVVAVHDVGTLGDRVWIAMEFLEGQTIGKWLKERPRAWRDVLEVFLQAGEGLKAAHAAGFVHRDFKPENVMLTTQGRVKVMDFGLARVESSQAEAPPSMDRLSQGQDADLTRTGVLLGTPRYMAPEQWKGAATDVRTDQFAFCVSLWEALYGAPPFEGETLAELAVSVEQGRLRAIPPGRRVPRWLDRVLVRGLKVDPSARWNSTDALLSALRADPTWRNRLLWTLVPLALATTAALVTQAHERNRRDEEISSRLRVAETKMRNNSDALHRAEAKRVESLRQFDAGETKRGNDLWSDYLADITSVEDAMNQVIQQLEDLLSVDVGRKDVRDSLLAGLFERATAAESRRLDTHEERYYIDRLRRYDIDGLHQAAWEEPGTLSVRTVPEGATVRLDHYDETGRRRIHRTDDLGTTPVLGLQLPRGSYRLRLEASGHAPVSYPLFLERKEALEVSLDMPASEQVPEGFIFIPAGRFFYGSAGTEDVREAFLAEPVHTVNTGPYLIARHETTWSDFIAFVESLPLDKRDALLADGLPERCRLTPLPNGQWQLELNQTSSTYTAKSGEPLVYEGRTSHAAVEWERLPLSGFSPEEMSAYLGWLDSSGRIPGARFCNEHEWERAARGGDERRFSHGDQLDPSEANIDKTYGQIASAFGPDPVGSYPQSESPFGVMDMIGNVYEVTVSPHKTDLYVARGGAFYFSAFGAQTAQRFEVSSTFRLNTVGFRVCATWPPPR